VALTWDSFATTWDDPATWDGAVPITGTGVLLGGGVATVLVQIAFGANLTASSGTWTWTDVTSSVMYDGMVNITQGRDNETSQAQPAQCSFTLLNNAGDFTPYNPNSQYYPNVRRNTPVRVSLDPGGGFVAVFCGFAVGFPPAWDVTGKLPTVAVTASGTLRRIDQGKTPLRSPLYRAVTANVASLAAYWPLEEDSGSVTGLSYFTNGSSLKTRAGTPVFGSTAPAGAVNALDLSDLTAYLSATLPTMSGATSWQVGFAFRATATGTGAGREVMKILCSGGYVVDISVSDGSAASGFENLLLSMTDTSTNTIVTLVGDGTPVMTGDWHYAVFTITPSGSAQRGRMYIDGVLTFDVTSGVASSPNYPISVQPGNPPGSSTIIPSHAGAFEIDHIYFAPDVIDHQVGFAINGYAGENPTARMVRISAEEDVPLTVTGTSTALMGAQPVDTYLNIMRECEAADGGVLYDGFDFGIGYICLSSRYNLSAALTLDVANAEVDDPLSPTDDDLRNRNDMTVSRSGGSSARFIDVTGVLGTDAIGTYDSSLTVNTKTDDPLVNIASWQVHLGTVLGLRYPNLNIDLIATPSKVAAWLAATPISFRVDVQNIVTKATQAPPGTVSLIVEGYTQRINNFTWQVVCNCSPFDPWRVFVVADSTLGRIDTGASVMNSSHSAGATSFGVNTTSGALWVTTATNPGDFPFDIGCNGEQMTVTAITGTSNPQTFTVTRAINGISKATNTNDVVSLWKPTSIAL
jgi:hypothetical protein